MSDESHLQDDVQDSRPPESSRTTSRRSEEPLSSRLRLVLWARHQPYIAGLLFACLIGMSVFFVHRVYIHSGIIDIDKADPLHAEFMVDINSAELGEIVVLPGVGEKLAQAIVNHRQSDGPFRTLDALRDVPGIGEKKFEMLRPFLLPIEDR